MSRRRGSAELKDSREKSALAIQRRQRRKSNPDMSMMGGGGGSEGFALSDANDEGWVLTPTLILTLALTLPSSLTLTR